MTTSSAASSAWACVSATTSTTGSPAKRTLSEASNGCGAKAKGSPVCTLASA